MKNLLGVFLVSALMISAGVYMAYRSGAPAERPDNAIVGGQQQELPSPIAPSLPQPSVKIVTKAPAEKSRAEVSRARAASTPEPESPKAELGGTDWAVVAAIYREYDPAARRARDIAAGSAFRASVFPARGQGSKYMVVLASGMTQGKAMQIRERAVSGGLPGDTYVTRLASPVQE